VFETVPVFREELVLLTPRGHPAVRDARDVALTTLIAFEQGCAYRTHAESWYIEHGLRPSRVLELGSYHAIVACVAAGAGVAFAPRSVLALLPDSNDIGVHTLAGMDSIDTLLVWRRGHFSSALNALRGMLVASGNVPANSAANLPAMAA
jgi:DNA-binding transcriptional LysR family regulator